jgi:osmoprotectant transport system substrate-binding protein
VPLTDPRNVFIAENVVPLVYKAGVNATVIGALNAVSARLTLADLLNLDTKIMLDRDSTVAVARDWLTQVGLS